MHSREPFSGARSRTRRRTRCKAGTLSHTSRTPTVITVTSADSRAGRTTVTVNLAVALAERGRHVLVLDADVARPNVCALLGFEHQSGIHDLLTGVRTLDEVLVVGPRGVYLVPGTMRERSELGVLEQAALIWAIDAMRQRIDVLLIDTAAGHRSEVATFARAAHHVLVVLRDGPASADRTLAFITCLSREHAVHHYKVLASQTPTLSAGAALYHTLQDACDRQLEITLEHAGTVPHDESVQRAIQTHRSVADADPQSHAARAFRALWVRRPMEPAK